MSNFNFTPETLSRFPLSLLSARLSTEGWERGERTSRAAKLYLVNVFKNVKMFTFSRWQTISQFSDALFLH